MNNMMIRGAIGESLALAFLPLVISGLYQIIVGNSEKWWLLVIGATGVVQSHILSTVIYVLISGVVILASFKVLITEKRWTSIIKATLVTILINMWSLIPMITFYLNGNLALDSLNRNAGRASVSWSYILGIFEIFKEGSNDIGRDYSLRLPIVVLLGICILCVIVNKKSKENSFWGTIFWISMILLFCASNALPYEYIEKYKFLENIFLKLQFPWRLIGVSGCLIIIISSIWLYQAEWLRKYSDFIMCIVIACILVDTANWDLGLQRSMTGYESGDDIYQTELSDKVCRNLIVCPPEYLLNPSADYSAIYELSNENVSVLSYERDYLDISFSYIDYSLNENSYIILPFINYIGYKATDESGQELTLNTNENGVAVLELISDAEIHDVHVTYKEPLYFRIGEIISVCTFIICIVLVIYNRIKNGRRDYYYDSTKKSSSDED